MNRFSDKNKTCAVIPFYNEEKFLPILLPKVNRYVDYIICIDDGSTDNSSGIINDFENLFLITNEINMGKGYSIRKGLEKAVELGFQKVVTIDADLQHDPGRIPGFLNLLDTHELVLGNRLNDISEMPFHRILSNKITSFLVSARFKKKIPDSQCGFRAFRCEILDKILPTQHGYEAETEMLFYALRKNYKLTYMSVPTIYGEEKSKMRNYAATIGFLKVYFTK